MFVIALTRQRIKKRKRVNKQHLMHGVNTHLRQRVQMNESIGTGR